MLNLVYHLFCISIQSIIASLSVFIFRNLENVAIFRGKIHKKSA